MHAYLIMAHNDFYILETLIRMINDERNDIYIHIDQKVKNFDFDYYRRIATKSKVFYIKRRNIQWGSFNMIKTELELYKSAMQNGNYEYYHLISGSDLPLKSQDEIHDFFSKNEGYEFIDIMRKEALSKLSDSRIDRFKYYHLFNNIGINKRGIGRANNILLKIQKNISIDRYKNAYEYGFGSQWASLTKNAVKLILEKEEWINKTYRFTHCCDEIYKQTVLCQNKNLKIYQGEIHNAQYIIWDAGDSSRHPHVITSDDYEALKKSECVFARKFDSNVDKAIIDRLQKELC